MEIPLAAERGHAAAVGSFVGKSAGELAVGNVIGAVGLAVKMKYV